MYHSRIILSVRGSVWYMVRNHRCTVTMDSVLTNSKTHNAFLSPAYAMFRHDCTLAVKPASTPQRLLPKQTLTESLPVDMLSAVSVLVVAQPSSKVQELSIDKYRSLSRPGFSNTSPPTPSTFYTALSLILLQTQAVAKFGVEFLI